MLVMLSMESTMKKESTRSTFSLKSTITRMTL